MKGWEKKLFGVLMGLMMVFWNCVPVFGGRYFENETGRFLEVRLMYGLPLLAAGLAAFLWYRFGRDRKIAPAPEYLPPTGVTSAEVGFIIDGFSDDKDLFSLLIYWANEGYLTIELKNKTDFTLVKQRPLPETAKAYEKTLFSGLFSGSDQVDLSRLEGSFSNTLKKAKGQIRKYFEENKEKRQFAKSSILVRGGCLLLMCIPFLSIGILGTLLTYQSHSLIWRFVFFVSLMFFCFLPALEPGKLWENSPGRMKVFCIVLPLFLGILSIVILTMMTFFRYDRLPLAWALGAASTVLCLLMMILTKKRTRRGILGMKRILGFQEFIKNANWEKLEAVMAMNPNYFYKVLPYAYVFDLSKEWIKQFEQIQMDGPEWYYTDSGSGTFNATFFIHAFHSRSKAMSSRMWEKKL